METCCPWELPLGIGAKRGSLVAGVVFDNTGGAGKVCFRKENFRSYRCVGHVKHVTIFKGSRLFMIQLSLEAKGDHILLNHYRKRRKRMNIYVSFICSMDNFSGTRRQGSTKPASRFMDVSGKSPDHATIRQDPSNRVTHETNENDVIKLKASDDEVVVEIRVTGYATDVDIL
ncbi:hypothetical protein OS493_008665 [Desmophyllum pertusum]|uniref:Uncharacterized protein n=1 Tax=Desmophyllum pertusum TaxID=174260 RepID=A0A9W9ZV48_9CNID|nr:hypothetical protein OS493_008665 [Desmophyllum pertusum]